MMTIAIVTIASGLGSNPCRCQRVTTSVGLHTSFPIALITRDAILSTNPGYSWIHLVEFITHFFICRSDIYNTRSDDDYSDCYNSFWIGFESMQMPGGKNISRPTYRFSYCPHNSRCDIINKPMI